MFANSFILHGLMFPIYSEFKISNEVPWNHPNLEKKKKKGICFQYNTQVQLLPPDS